MHHRSTTQRRKVAEAHRLMCEVDVLSMQEVHGTESEMRNALRPSGARRGVACREVGGRLRGGSRSSSRVSWRRWSRWTTLWWSQGGFSESC